MKSSVTGTVAAISDYSDKDFFNIALDDADKDDNWFIGDGSVRDYVSDGLDNGQRVRLSFDNESVNGIEVVGSGSNSDSSGEGEGSSDQGNTSVDSGRGTATDKSSNLNSDERQRLGISFKKAVDTVNEHGDFDSQGEHLERVGELTNGYFNLLEAQAKDKSQGSGGGE